MDKRVKIKRFSFTQNFIQDFDAFLLSTFGKKRRQVQNKIIKPLLMEYIEQFDNKVLGFTEINHYNTCIVSLLSKNQAHCLNFYFSIEECHKIKNLSKKLKVTESFLIRLILVAIVHEKAQKTYTVLLSDICHFFCAGINEYGLILPIPKEIKDIADKQISKAEYRNVQDMLRTALFYQLFYGKNFPPKNEEILKVTPDKTGWKNIIFKGSSQIKTFLENRGLGKTRPIVLLNTYLTYTEALLECAK